jgi:TolA-binding protein
MSRLDPIKRDTYPPSGLLDNVEQLLFDRIQRFEQKHPVESGVEFWEAAIAQDLPFSAETTEILLFERISSLDGVDTWELQVKKETADFDFDAAEKRLAASSAVAKAPTYSFPGLFFTSTLSLFKKGNFRYTVALLASLALAVGGWQLWQNTASSLATTVIAPGEKGFALSATRGQTVQSLPGQRLVLQNFRGTVVAENGARITLKEIHPDVTSYSLAFTESSFPQQAKAIFSVTKRLAGQEFSVITKDYIIHVVGTVFTVTPQAHQRVATKVFEGTVRVEGRNFSALVNAGSVLCFDDRAGAYVVTASDTAHQATESLEARRDSGSIPAQSGQRRIGKPIMHNGQSQDSLFDNAMRLEQIDWQKAIDAYNLVLGRHGSSPFSREIALFSVARLRFDHDTSLVDVRKAFEAYLKVFPHGNFAGESYLRLTDLAYKNDPKQALAWCERYLAEFPATQNAAAAEYKAGLILLQQNRREQAATMLTEALKHSTSCPPAQIVAIQRALDNAKNVHADSNGRAKK